MTVPTLADVVGMWSSRPELLFDEADGYEIAGEQKKSPAFAGLFRVAGRAEIN